MVAATRPTAPGRGWKRADQGEVGERLQVADDTGTTSSLPGNGRMRSVAAARSRAGLSAPIRMRTGMRIARRPGS